MLRKRVRTVAHRGLLLLGAVGLTLALTPAPAAAGGIGYTGVIRHWATGVCLDSNYGGSAYAIGCNGGNYQRWFIGGTGEFYQGRMVIVLRNNQTDRCLDSNVGGSVYTRPCQDRNYYQYWIWYGNDYVGQYRDRATGLCLQSNGAALYTQVCGSNFQDWRQGY